MGIRCHALTGILGEEHDPELICPNVVIARDFDAASDNLQIMDFIRVQVREGEVSFHAAHAALKLLLELFQKTAIDEIISALGWFLAVDAAAFVNQDAQCIRLVRKPAAIALIHEDLVFCLAISFFLARIRNWST